MKTKFFAALTAAALLCGAMTAPASAEQKYQIGDVNMDGEVSVEDPYLVLIEYVDYCVGCAMEHVLTPEQLALADVDGLSRMTSWGEPCSVTLEDAHCLFRFYVYTVSDPDQKGTDVRAWVRANYPNMYEQQD